MISFYANLGRRLLGEEGRFEAARYSVIMNSAEYRAAEMTKEIDLIPTCGHEDVRGSSSAECIAFLKKSLKGAQDRICGFRFQHFHDTDDISHREVGIEIESCGN